MSSNNNRKDGENRTKTVTKFEGVEAQEVIDSQTKSGADSEPEFDSGRTEKLDSHTDIEYLVTPESDVSPTLSVVMPTLDEEEGIVKCMEQIFEAIEHIEVPTEIVVSDSSSDRTPEIALEMGAHVVKPADQGYGAAYLEAFKHVRGEFIAVGDADCTYDFRELPKLYRPVASGAADMAIGSRLQGEISPGSMPPLHQYVGNPLLTKFLNVFYDAGVSDAHSGFRVLSMEAIESINLQSTGMEFASEMIMKANAENLTITERPITYHKRVGEATLDSFKDGWRHVRFMLMNAPGYLFSAPAFIFMVTGLATMFMSYVGVEFFDLNFGVQTAFAGSIFIVVGYQIGSFALFSSIISDPIREPQDPITRILRKNLRLEHGATVGLALFSTGVFYTVVVVSRWIESGYTILPRTVSSIGIMTVIIIGLQTIFSSFFLSMVATSGGVQR